MILLIQFLPLLNYNIFVAWKYVMPIQEYFVFGLEESL